MTTNGIAKVGQGEATRTFGTRGLSIWGKQIHEEYLPGLANWITQFRIFREMMDDIVIGTAFDAMFGPLLAADFDAVPAGDTPGDKDAATFLWDVMNGMNRQTWRSHVVDMLESVPFGFAIGEMVFEKRDDGRLWIANIDPRGQETLDGWQFDEHENVLAFIQRFPIGGRLEPIPIEKLVHMTFRGRKGNPQGKGMLRSMFRTFKFLKNFENFEGIGVERDVGGTPVFTWPENFQPSDDDQAKVEEMLKGLQMDQELYVILPFGTLEPYSGGSKVYDVGAIIDRKKKELLMRVFAQFLMLGMEQVGTQALVQGSQDFFSLSLQAIQQEMLDTWQKQFVPLLFRFNTFPGMTDLPLITWSDPGRVDITGMLASVQAGIAAGVLTPTLEDEDHFRAIMDLPDLPEGVGEGPRGPLVAPMQPSFPGFLKEVR